MMMIPKLGRCSLAGAAWPVQLGPALFRESISEESWKEPPQRRTRRPALTRQGRTITLKLLGSRTCIPRMACSRGVFPRAFDHEEQKVDVPAEVGLLAAPLQRRAYEHYPLVERPPRSCYLDVTSRPSPHRPRHGTTLVSFG
jgi:hypothetical protein